MGKKNKNKLKREGEPEAHQEGSGDNMEEPLLESGMSDRVGEPAPVEERKAEEPLGTSETTPIQKSGMNINASDLSKGMGTSVMSSQNEKEKEQIVE